MRAGIAKPEWLQRHWGPLVFVLALLLTLAGGYGLIRAGLFFYRQSLSEVADFQAFRSLQRNLGQADSLARRYENWGRRLKAVQSAAPAENHASHVLQLLVEKAGDEGLTLSEISGLNEMPLRDAVEFPFELSLEGGFQNLARYIHALENQDMVLQVRRLSVQAEAMHQPGITARLGVSVYLPARKGNEGAAK